MKTKYSFLFSFWLITFSIFAQSTKEIIILHTNDTHSRIEPLPLTDPYNPGKGGVVNRKAMIDSIRNVHSNILLLDAGDFVQGTPYYNLFKGRAEVESLNLIGYDAVTLGNHEFDYGLDTLQMILQKLDCPVICCNYNVTNTPLKGVVQPYHIFERGGVKIGVIGAGIQPDGLIQKDKYAGPIYLPVIETVNKYARILRKKKKCDIIICLSHIGHSEDIKLAQASEHIDIIIGGHSHTFLEQPVNTPNQKGKEVFVYQAGSHGSQIGEIKITLQKGRSN